MFRWRYSTLTSISGIIIALTIQTSATDSVKCPIGYEYIKSWRSDEEYCFKKKPPEVADDKYANCGGNLFTRELIRNLNMMIEDGKYWAEYKSAYEEGPLIDTSFGSTSGEPLDDKLDIPDVKKEYCSVFDARTRNLTLVDCEDKYPSYCFIKTYDESDEDICEDPYETFTSPIPACIRVVRGQNASGKDSELQTPRANWQRASKTCKDKNATLLLESWIYANNKELRPADEVNTKIPLGIVIKNGQLWWNNDAKTLIPHEEWSFFDNEHVAFNLSSDSELKNVSIALSGEYWSMVPESELFYHILCEKPLQLRTVNMTLFLIKGKKVGLRLSESLSKKNIKCFTDSVTYHPTPIEISDKEDNTKYELKTKSNGYYWCINIDTVDYKTSNSNKLLYIHQKEALINDYAMKIKLREEEFSLGKLDKIRDVIKELLNEYLYLRSLYAEKRVSNNENNSVTEEEMIVFKNGVTDIGKVITDFKIKRIYPNSSSVLVHATVKDNVKPLYFNETWKGLNITMVRPAYFCEEYDGVSSMALGQVGVLGCRRLTCTTHDFNEGVFWIEEEDCQRTVNLTTEIVVDNITTINDGSRFDDSNTTIVPTIPTRPVVNTTMEANDATTPTSTSEVTTATLRPPRPTTFPTPTTTAPDQILQNILDNLENALEDPTIEIDFDFIGETTRQLDELLGIESNVEIPGSLLTLFGTACVRADLGGNTELTLFTENIALGIADSSEGHRVTGLVYNSNQLENAVEIITNSSSTVPSSEHEIKVNLPSAASEDDQRVTFLVFTNDRAFTSKENATSAIVNSRVVSITVGNLTSFPEGQFIDIQLQPSVTVTDDDTERACAFWSFDGDGFGEWSTEGCELITNEDGPDFCRCNHLTHFAEIIAPYSNFSDTQTTILGILSLIGCILSLIGLILIAATGIAFHSWRKDFGNKIWLSLSCSIFLLIIMFLVVYFADVTRNKEGCVAVGVLLHYSVLSSFCWMVVAAALSYKRLVLVFTKYSSHKLLKASAFSWGIPVLIICILFAVDPKAYSTEFGENIRSFCYPEGLYYWISLFLPITLALVINAILFALIVKAVFASRRIKRYGDTNEALRFASVSFVLVFLFGLPWVFGLFSSILVFAYLFTITATLQGFILFCFFIIGNKKTRDLWLNLLNIKKKGTIPVTTSSYRSGNMAATQSTNIIPNGNGSVVDSLPKSLAGQDDARFS